MSIELMYYVFIFKIKRLRNYWIMLKHGLLLVLSCMLFLPQGQAAVPLHFADFAVAAQRHPEFPGLLTTEATQQPWVVVKYQLAPDVMLTSGISATHWPTTTDASSLDSPANHASAPAPKLWSMGVEQQILQGVNLWVGYQASSTQDEQPLEQVAASVKMSPVAAMTIDVSGQYRDTRTMGVLAQTSFRF